jgi:transcriptional regulator with XRE-family HTH domain
LPGRGEGNLTGRITIADAKVDMAVAIRVRQAREIAGYSQRGFAHVLGIGFGAYQHNEAGRTRIPANRLAQIAQLTGVSISFLMGEKEKAA